MYWQHFTVFDDGVGCLCVHLLSGFWKMLQTPFLITWQTCHHTRSTGLEWWLYTHMERRSAHGQACSLQKMVGWRPFTPGTLGQWLLKEVQWKSFTDSRCFHGHIHRHTHTRQQWKNETDMSLWVGSKPATCWHSLFSRQTVMWLYRDRSSDL